MDGELHPMQIMGCNYSYVSSSQTNYDSKRENEEMSYTLFERWQLHEMGMIRNLMRHGNEYFQLAMNKEALDRLF